MKALTLWQPWASLVMIGAKSAEYRKWDYGARYPMLIGQRIVMHAGTRPIRAQEVEDILQRIQDGVSTLNAELAVPLLERLMSAYRCKGVLELGAGLGTFVLGRAHKPQPVTDLPDSYRHDHHIWAWPMTEIERWDEPRHRRGSQGFWNWGDTTS